MAADPEIAGKFQLGEFVKERSRSRRRRRVFGRGDRDPGENARNGDRSQLCYPLKTIKHVRPEPMLRTVKY